MRKVVLGLLFVAGLIMSAQAQEKTKAEIAVAKQEEQAEIYAAAGISESEILQLKEISKEADQKVRSVRRDKSISEEDRKARLKEISKEKKDKVIALLGEEKYNNWQKAKKQAAAAKK